MVQPDPTTKVIPPASRAAWPWTRLESHFAQDDMGSISVYARRIRDVMLLPLWHENGVWVSVPTNGGGAEVHGIEFASNLPLTTTAAVAVAD